MTAAQQTPSADCRVALLTPVGRGAIATISVHGKQAVALVERFFQPLGRRALSTVPIRSILVGHWRSGAGQSEEVVVTRCDETRVEINCHGGIAASNAILTALTVAGATLENSETWLAEHIPDSIQRAAWQAISLARTERAAGILFDQWRGALAVAIREVRELLRTQPAQFELAAQRVARLIRLGDVGLHLCVPWRVVLAGPPNVGKSSLANALLGYERCIVFDEPGTTRDVLTATTAFDGWAVELSDTAGYRESTDAVEQEGTRRAWQQLEEADLAVIVVDVSQPIGDYVPRFQAAARASIVVANKIDRCDSATRIPAEWLPTSAMTGQGIDNLVREMIRKLVPILPRPGEAVPFTSQQLDLLQQAQTAISARDHDSAGSILSRLLEADL